MIDLEGVKLLHAQKSSGAGGITYGLVSVQRSSSGFSRCLLLKRADDFDEQLERRTVNTNIYRIK